MRKPTELVILLLILAWALRPGAAQAPPEKVYEPFVKTTEYEEAWRLLDASRFEEFRARMAEIAAANPGTTLGAVCLFKQSGWSESSDRPRILNAIIAGYPRSRFEIWARLDLLNGQYGYSDMEGWLADADRLAQSYGGPPLAAILRGRDLDRLSAQVLALPVEVRYGLAEVYGEMLGGLVCQLKQYERAVPLAIFGRQAFSMHSDGIISLEYILTKAKTGTWSHLATKFVSPTVRVIHPRHARHTGPRPKIRLEMFRGDVSVEGIDLRRSTILLDGQDFWPRLRARVRVDKSLKPGRVFERILLSGRPALPLAPGRHTLEIVARSSGYYQESGTGLTRTLVEFTVGKSHDDDCDRREDDARDWEQD